MRACGAIAPILFAGTAAAVERGGVESPFAAGVGARALALGGAYVAVAEGPTAAAWNPAGLAFGERKKIVFFYTSPFVEGNRYTFAGYQHPFLGLGTFGFGNSRYGVDGIDKYDAGGAALGTFSSVQNEWIFSYALPPMGPLALGASVKAETHSIDGHRATGIGADLGAIVRAEGSPETFLSGRNVAFGCAVQNALRPTLALAEGEDRHPMLLRAGLAYRIPLARGSGNLLTLLGGVDLGAESGSRARAGAECVLDNGLSLRIGANDEEWASGLGIEIANGRLDYTFGSMELGSIHRLELSFAFGKSLRERIEEARNREEQKLGERTEEELAKKEERQHGASLEEGNALLAHGEYSGAEAAFERALLWDPESAEAADGLRKARVERRIAAGDARLAAGDLLEAIAEYRAALAIDPDDERASRLAAETTERLDRSTARSREVGERLARGIEHLALSDFAKARAEFEKALEIEPGNADAMRYQARADSLVALRVDILVEEGNWFRDRGRPETAIERYGEALAFRPDRDDLAREIARLRAGAPSETRRDEPVAPPSETPAPRPLTADELREAERMYRSGLDAFKAGRYGEANRYFEFVYGLSRAYENAESYLKQSLLFLGMDLYTGGRLEEAIRNWERILEIDPEDEKALSYLGRARAEARKTQDLPQRTQ